MNGGLRKTDRWPWRPMRLHGKLCMDVFFSPTVESVTPSMAKAERFTRVCLERPSLTFSPGPHLDSAGAETKPLWLWDNRQLPMSGSAEAPVGGRMLKRRGKGPSIPQSFSVGRAVSQMQSQSPHRGLVQRSCRKDLLEGFAGRSCRKVLPDGLVGRMCWETLFGRTCWEVLENLVRKSGWKAS